MGWVDTAEIAGAYAKASTAAAGAATDAVAAALTDAAGAAIYATKVELSAAKTEIYEYLGIHYYTIAELPDHYYSRTFIDDHYRMTGEDTTYLGTRDQNYTLGKYTSHGNYTTQIWQNLIIGQDYPPASCTATFNGSAYFHYPVNAATAFIIGNNAYYATTENSDNAVQNYKYNYFYNPVYFYGPTYFRYPPGGSSVSALSYNVVITDGLETDVLHITGSILFPDSTTMTSANITQTQVNSSSGWITTALAARLTSIPANYLTTSSTGQSQNLITNSSGWITSGFDGCLRSTTTNQSQALLTSSSGWITTALSSCLTSIPSNYLTTTSSIQASQLTGLSAITTLSALSRPASQVT